MPVKNLNVLTDAAIAIEVGQRLRAYRLRMDITRENLAVNSGLAINTIKNLENGKGTLGSLIAMMRVLDLLDHLELLVPEPTISPLLMLHQPKPRQRARSKKE